MKIIIVYYSLYGHMKAMAQALAEGASSVDGVEGIIKRVPETLPNEVLEKMGALEVQKSFASIPIATPDDLASADGIILGSPTRFGNISGQMAQFLDSTGGLWQSGQLVGKVGSAFTSSATQHGGNEATLLSLHKFFLHQGMIIAGLPYAFQGQMGLDEIKGGSPYGITTIAGGTGERLPSEIELQGARYQGKYTAEIAKKLKS